MVKAKLGERVFVSNGSEAKVYSAVVGEGGSLTQLAPVTHRGGESVAVDRSGNLYVANGQIFVYGPDGQETGRIDVPERPLQLVFGGVDGKTLFILTHHACTQWSPDDPFWGAPGCPCCRAGGRVLKARSLGLPASAHPGLILFIKACHFL